MPISKETALKYHNLYTTELYEKIMPFWEKNSPDFEFGGYYNCLDEKGQVFDTDKFVWLQGREVWIFSKLYNTAPKDVVSEETRKNWLKLAELGAQFLEKYCHDEEGNFYFSVTRKGKPITQPHSIFSDCFAAMAFAQFSKAAGGLEWAKERAIKCFENIQRRKANPKGKYNKVYPGTRGFSSLAVPMIDVNLCMEMKEVIPTLDIQSRIEDNLNEIFEKFLDKKEGLLRENVADDPESQDTFEGRLINPGHSIEALWFIMDVCTKIGRTDLIEKCCTVLLRTLNYGWDKQHGGFFYFMDILNKPPQQLEWDQKLWWVHVEALVGLSMAYQLTKKEEFAEWYEKVHQYTWSHFPDPENGGEWFGYLNRKGEVLLKLKGGKWKCAFHIPRALFLCAENFKKIAESQ